MKFLKYLLYFSFVVFFQLAYSAIPKSVSSAEGDVVDVLVEGKEGLLTKVASGIFRVDGVFIEKLESENKSIEIYVLNKKRKELTVHNLMSGEELVEHKNVKTQIMSELKVQDFFVNVDSLLTKGGVVTVVEGKMVFLDLTDSKDVLREMNSKLAHKEKKIYIQVKDNSNVVKAYEAFYLPKSLQVSSGVSIEKPSSETLKVRDFFNLEVTKVVATGVVDGKIGYGIATEYGSSDDTKTDNVIFEPGTKKRRQLLLKIKNGIVWYIGGVIKSVDALVTRPLWRTGKFAVDSFRKKGEDKNTRKIRSDMVLAEGKEGVLVEVGTLKENGGIVINKVTGESKLPSEVYTLSENYKELLLHKVTPGELIGNETVETQIETKSKVQDFFLNIDNLLTKAGTVVVVEGKMVILEVVNTLDVKDFLLNSDLTYREKKIYVQVKDSSNVVKAYEAFYLPKSLQVSSGVSIEKPSSEILEVREFFNKNNKDRKNKVATGIVDGKIGVELLKLDGSRSELLFRGDQRKDNVIFEPGTKKVYQIINQIRNGYIWSETGISKIGNILLRAPIQLGKFLASPFSRKTPTQIGASKARRGR